jgi:hypothetical protein
MPLCNREGKFHAAVIELGVSESKSQLVMVVARFSLLELLDHEDWLSIENEGLEITGYFYLEKKDGSLNEMAINQLKEAFGWDGRDPFWMQDHQSELPQVQITTGYEDYQGQPKMRLQWLNAYDYAGSNGANVPKAGNDERRAIVGRLGAKLRGFAGGSPASSPAKPATAPATRPTTAPKSAPKPPSKAATKAKPTATMEEAWEAFVISGQERGVKQDDLEAEWFDQIADMREGATPENLTPEEWHVVKTTGCKSSATAASSNGSSKDDLPF